MVKAQSQEAIAPLHPYHGDEGSRRYGYGSVSVYVTKENSNNTRSIFKTWKAIEIKLSS